MRIISGSARGAKLKAPPGLDTRPTTDRVKESLFNILGPTIVDATILDLFAGTGSLGLEALSRGAKHAVFVDQSPVSIHVMKENAEHTHLAAETEFYKKDVCKALQRLDQDNRFFDIVFCDPPYNRGWMSLILPLLAEEAILKSGGILIFEHSRHESFEPLWPKLHEYRLERYGETMISFIAKR